MAFRLATALLFVCVFGGAAFAQNYSPYTGGLVCPGESITYTYNDETNWVTATWTPSNPSITITTVSALVRTIAWNVSGYVTVVLRNNQNVIVDQDVIYGTHYTAGTIGSPEGATGYVCQNTVVTLNRLDGVGASSQWQYKPTASSTWTDFGTAGLTQTFTIDQAYNFRVRPTGTGCSTQIPWSSTTTISPYASLSAGVVSGPTAICSNTSPGTFSETTAPSGGGASYTYQWQVTDYGANSWSNISGATSSTYSPGVLTLSKEYRRITKSLCNSSGTPTNVISILIYQPLVAGQIAGFATICPGATPATFTQTTAPQNGGGSYTYQWYAQPEFQSETAVSGATSATYNPGPVAVTTNYVRRDKSLCENTGLGKPTNYITVTVYTALDAGQIGGAITICPGATPGALSNTLAASSGGGSYTYTWETKPTSSGTWTTISGATSTTYQPGALSQDTDFRRIARSLCNSTGVPTTPVTISMYATLTPGTIGSNQTICSGSAPAALTAGTAPSNGGGSYTYQWQSRPVGGSWSNISGATAASYSPGSISTATEFQRITKSACNTTGLPTNVVTISMLTSGGATISPALVEGYGVVSTGTINLSAVDNTVVRWESSTNGGTSWTQIANTSTSLLYNNITVNTLYRALIQKGACTSAQAFTSNATINIYSVPAITLNGQQRIPLGKTTQLSTGSYYSTQWYKNDVAISGATSSTLTITEPGLYKVAAKQTATAPTYTTGNYTVGAIGAQNPASVNNAITTTVIRKAGVNENTNFYTTLAPTDYAQTITYQDGLGRAIQTVAIGQSPLGRDVVQPVAYNKYGETDTTYMGYVDDQLSGLLNTTAINKPATYSTSEQYLFYQQGGTLPQDTKPYAITLFEASPLGRAKEQGSPGTTWQPGSGHTVRTELRVNSQSGPTVLRDIKKWTPTAPAGSNYPDGTLAVARITDENGNEVYSFTDNDGRTLLKRVQVDATNYLETYYVYDDRGRLAMQIPPKAVALLNSGTTWSTTFRDEWCFVYTYDSRSRLVEKKVPDSAPVYYAYDPLDRLVLTQDGYLRTQNKWMFVKYDIKGRAVMSGLYLNTTTTDRATLQTTVLDPLYASGVWYEERGATLHGYTNVSFPTQNANATALEVLSVSYYDNYDFDNNGSDDFGYTSQGLAGEGTQFGTFGLPTGSKRAVYGTAKWLYNYVFYDRFGRTIQMRSNNHLSASVVNLVTNVYDFEGKVLLTKEYHNGGGTNQVTKQTRYDYDFAGRMLRTYQIVNGGAEAVVASVKYNELGQVVEKNLHCTTCGDVEANQLGAIPPGTITRASYSASETTLLATQSISFTPGFQVPAGSSLKARIVPQAAVVPGDGGQYLQSVDYRYNIRGWLTSINNAQLSNSGTNNNDTNDYFGMELSYDGAAGTGNTAQYNGNISAIKWKQVGEAAGNAGSRSYNYTYDKSDRLLTANFQAYNSLTSLWDKESNTLNEAMSYDQNGNILTLQRNYNQRGLSGTNVTSSAQPMDNLTYTYTTGNQLNKVTDAGNTTGFNNGSSGTNTDFTYNANGSLTADKNKGIDSVHYNVLGKVRRVKFTDGRFISYMYDASGTKLRMKTYNTAGDSVGRTDYVNGVQYENGAISFFASPGGRVLKNGSTFEYQYAITDHQGNTRVLFTSATPAPEQKATNLEAATNTEFQNYTNRVSFELYDHTDFSGSTYSHAQKLTGASGQQVGVAKSFKVYPGDKVRIEAYAKFANATSTTSNLAGFASALLNAYSLPAPGMGETGTASYGVNTWGSIVAAGSGPGGGGFPKAFVNLIVFDKNYQFLDVAYDQINGGEQIGVSPKAAHDLVAQEYIAKEEGYIYVYVSNENATLVDVYFDDVTITRTPGNIVQYNEYYPFGLQTSNSWTRENVTGNNYLNNGGTELNKLTGDYETQFREYDPVLGRMNGVDVMADKYGSLTPYNYAFNSPVVWNDPTGADPPTKEQIEQQKAWDAERQRVHEAGKKEAFNSTHNPYFMFGVVGDDSVFERYATWNGTGTVSSNEFEQAHLAAKAEGGKVRWGRGGYWIEGLPVYNYRYIETPDDPNYSGFFAITLSAGTRSIFVSTTTALSETGVGAALAAGAATGWTLGMNIERFSEGVAGLLIRLGVPPEVLIEPGYGDPKKWTASKGKPKTLQEYEPEENHFPPDNNNTNSVALIMARIAAATIALTELGFDVGKISLEGGIDGAKSFVNDLKNKAAQGIRDVENGFKNGWPAY